MLLMLIINYFIWQNNLVNMGERPGFYVVEKLTAVMSKLILDGNMLSLPKVV